MLDGTIGSVRGWLDSHPCPTPPQLAEAGLVAPGWPPPHGLGLDPVRTAAVHDIVAEYGIDPHSHNPIGIGWAGPTLLAGGTTAQQERYLPHILDGSEFWCQLFSEPGAGSDLASLSTRAQPVDGGYLVTGQKVWNTYAEKSDFGILLARTDADGPKHAGLSYFVCPMDSSGITVRPIRQMTGRFGFCEVFFEEVFLSNDLRVGAEGDGWRLARTTLGNERMTLSSGGVLWGNGPTTDDLVARFAGDLDPLARDRLTSLVMDAKVMDMLAGRIRAQIAGGAPPHALAAIKKYLADGHGQRVMDFAKTAMGQEGMLDVREGPDAEWHEGFLYARALTIGGGTSQVLANILAETVLGLPKDLKPASG